jgi:hypothetical protein
VNGTFISRRVLAMIVIDSIRPQVHPALFDELEKRSWCTCTQEIPKSMSKWMNKWRKESMTKWMKESNGVHE